MTHGHANLRPTQRSRVFRLKANTHTHTHKKHITVFALYEEILLGKRQRIEKEAIFNLSFGSCPYESSGERDLKSVKKRIRRRVNLDNGYWLSKLPVGGGPSVE